MTRSCTLDILHDESGDSARCRGTNRSTEAWVPVMSPMNIAGSSCDERGQPSPADWTRSGVLLTWGSNWANGSGRVARRWRATS